MVFRVYSCEKTQTYLTMNVFKRVLSQNKCTKGLFCMEYIGKMLLFALIFVKKKQLVNLKKKDKCYLNGHCLYVTKIKKNHGANFSNRYQLALYF